ncbi:MAG TPA: amidohydrolase [Streptomyces sp.]|nr:amidohydrolase [Streptomyces sp.]
MREDETGEQPVRVFTGSRIEPLDGTRPEAFAVRGERVAATGSRAELADRFPAVERVDLDGALVVPGFNDAHCHTSQAALARVRVDVSDARTADEVLAALRARAALVPPGEWVVGQGLHEDALSGRVDRDLLDRASAEHPVVVIQYTFHRAVANTAALERIGYRTEADAPSGGQLLTTADGRLDGWMYERAWLDPWLPGSGRESIAPGGEPSAQLAALREVNTELHRLGITSYCDAIVTPLEQEMYAAAHRLGQLTPRVSMLLWHSYFDPRAWPAEQPDAHRLQLAGVKLMLDGALSGGTCLCRQPYPSATGGDNGLQVLDDAGFQRTVRSVHAAGARVAVHANGDLAISKVLDVLESLVHPPSGERINHRLEHCSITDEGLIERIRAAGATPVPFGAFVAHFGEAIERFYGAERAAMACAHKSMLDAGIAVAGSSDFPIIPIDPLPAIRSMVTRRTAGGGVLGPDQRLSVTDALGVYTHGSAHATGEGRVKGRLAAGQSADFTVLDTDLAAVDPQEITSARVTSTWVGGSCVWSAGS